MDIVLDCSMLSKQRSYLRRRFDKMAEHAKTVGDPLEDLSLENTGLVDEE